MSILIEGATIVAMDAAHGSEPFRGDILIEGERIAAVGAAGTGAAGSGAAEAEAERVIPGRGQAGRSRALSTAISTRRRPSPRGATTTCRWSCG